MFFARRRSSNSVSGHSPTLLDRLGNSIAPKRNDLVGGTAKLRPQEGGVAFPNVARSLYGGIRERSSSVDSRSRGRAIVDVNSVTPAKSGIQGDESYP